MRDIELQHRLARFLDLCARFDTMLEDGAAEITQICAAANAEAMLKEHEVEEVEEVEDVEEDEELGLMESVGVKRRLPELLEDDSDEDDFQPTLKVARPKSSAVPPVRSNQLYKSRCGSSILRLAYDELSLELRGVVEAGKYPFVDGRDVALGWRGSKGGKIDFLVGVDFVNSHILGSGSKRFYLNDGYVLMKLDGCNVSVARANLKLELNDKNLACHAVPGDVGKLDNRAVSLTIGDARFNARDLSVRKPNRDDVGLQYFAATNNWKASIWANNGAGMRKHVGTFDTKQSAMDARDLISPHVERFNREGAGLSKEEFKRYLSDEVTKLRQEKYEDESNEDGNCDEGDELSVASDSVRKEPEPDDRIDLEAVGPQKTIMIGKETNKETGSRQSDNADGFWKDDVKDNEDGCKTTTIDLTKDDDDDEIGNNEAKVAPNSSACPSGVVFIDEDELESLPEPLSDEYWKAEETFFAELERFGLASLMGLS
ncbi:hypothetical protein HDU79_000799 [Rhizoclosmatium sp. JEL0117]|nr:hypothetical protein HDU79_000799 [Rhizoclosmatium sp. JEL0117]